MANFIINLAGIIASIAVPLSNLPSGVPADAITNIAIGIGGSDNSDPNTGGSVPHVALWDKHGGRIGQYTGNANGHLDQNTVWSFSIDNYQTEPQYQQRQPEYIMLAMEESDAICISHIYASGNGAQWAWFGDIGYTCGADWYPSSFIVGDGTYTPKCVWIDQDYSNGLRFQGLSLHMPDFASTDDRVTEYNADPDTLCKSTSRMNFWPSIVPDAEIPIFNPPLTYTNGGADVDPSSVINKSRRRSTNSPRAFRHKNGNNKPSHLVVSNLASHSAKEVCESDTSIGPDFVSTVEGIFCDTAEKEWWYLCSSTITTSCFDLAQQMMVGDVDAIQATGHNGTTSRIMDTATGRVVPYKTYVTSEVWQ